jgi:acyl carrier protein
MTSLRSAGVGVAEVRTTISAIARDVLDRDVDPAVDLFDQGATSLAFLRIIAQIGERYGVTVDVAELEEARLDTIADIVSTDLSTPAPESDEDGR